MDTEEKIIEATVQCIEEVGLTNTTIRRISAKAGVNSAAISYYFRSKDALIERVMEATLDNAFRWEDFAYTEGMPLEEQLFEIFYFFASSALVYPRLTQAHLYDILSEGNYDTPITSRLNAFVERISEECRRKLPDTPEEDIRFSLMQITAATLLFFAMTPQIFTPFSHLDLTQEEARRHYVHGVVRGLLPKESKKS